MKSVLPAAATALILALSASAPASAEEAALRGPLLNLSAYGEVHATPDLASIEVGSPP